MITPPAWLDRDAYPFALGQVLGRPLAHEEEPEAVGRAIDNFLGPPLRASRAAPL